MISCVLLAAGASARMGSPKLHLPFGRSTVLGCAVEAARAAGLGVVVVGRPGDESVARYAIAESVRVVINPDPDRGMLFSLQAGLAAAAAAAGADVPCFFAPGDMPMIDPSSYRKLLAAESGGAAIAAYRGRRGHPVLLSAPLVRAVLALGEGDRLRDLIDASAPLFVETDDPGVISDIDLPSDYKSARKHQLAAMMASPASSASSPSCIPRAAE